jgi:hypothetical protein
MVKRVEVLHVEFPLQDRYGVLQERCARCGEHNIINIKQQVYRISATVEDELGGFGLGLNKSQSEEVCGEPVVPSLGCLLQPVERLVEATYPVRLCGINKPHRMAAVDYLWESIMQKRVLHIKLMDGPGTWDSQGKHRADGVRLDNRAESLIVVDTRPLGEAAKTPTSLVSFQGAVRVKLVLEDPFAGDDVGANRTRDKIPSVVGDQSIIFFLHGMTLGWVGESGVDGGGHRRERRWWGGWQCEFVGL